MINKIEGIKEDDGYGNKGEKGDGGGAPWSSNLDIQYFW